MKQAFQVAFNALVPAAYTDPANPTSGGVCAMTPETSGYTWHKTATLPYAVPKGFYLHVTDAHFASKFVNFDGQTRSSYLVIPNVFTLTELNPSISLRQPFIVPGENTLEAIFYNNSIEAQWMNGFIAGWLSRKVNE